MRRAHMTRIVLMPLLLAAGVVCAPAAFAQVYKWTDERGGINYGSKPPPNARNVSLMREDDGKVSTIPGVPPEAAGAPSADQRRADQLQRELDAERRANAARAAPGGSTLDYQAWREQCLAERRVDCDDPNRGTAYVPPGYGYAPGFPVYPVPPIARPPLNRPVPVPPTAQQPWPQGNAVVPSPPQTRRAPEQLPPPRPSPRPSPRE